MSIVVCTWSYINCFDIKVYLIPIPIPPIKEYLPQSVIGDAVVWLEVAPKSVKKLKIRGINLTSSFVVHKPDDSTA